MVCCLLFLHHTESAEGDLLSYLEAHLPAVHVFEFTHPLRDPLWSDEFLYPIGDVCGDLGVYL